MEDNKQILEELQTLRKLQQATEERITQLEGQLRYKTAIKVASNGNIYSGVMASSIKPYIQEWIDNGHTLIALADKAGVSESVVSKILNNERDMIRVSTADSILTALGVNPSVYDSLVPQPPESKYYEE